MSGTTTNQRLNDWVSEWAAVMQPADIYWCDGSADEYEVPVPATGRLRHLHQARRGEAPEQLLGTLRSGRCGPSRGPHLHLCGERGRRRPEQQLARSGRDARGDEAAVHGFDEGPHHVRRAVLDGSARLADRPHRRPAHRLGVCRSQHENHDPDGSGRARCPRQQRLGAVPAFRRGTARRRRDGRSVAMRRREQVHRALPGDPRDLVVRIRLRRQRPARQEVLRAAHRLGDGPRQRLARRAHAHPEAHEPRGRVEVHRRRLPVGVRQDQPRHARSDDSRLEGRDHRRRHLLDEVRRRRPALRDQSGSRLLRCCTGYRLGHQLQRHGDPLGQLRLHQHGAHRRR